MIRLFGHDYLSQQAGSRSALLDRLGRFGCRFHRACTGVGEASILDHLHLGGNIFIVLADLFADPPYVLVTAPATLLAIRQIVLECVPASGAVAVAFSRVTYFHWPHQAVDRRPCRVLVRFRPLPGSPGQFRSQQHQLFQRKLFALTPGFCLEQLPQQTLGKQALAK